MVWKRHEIIATEWFLLAVTLIMVCIRVYVKVTTVYRPWRELLVVFAWFTGLFYAIIEYFYYYKEDLIDYYENPEELTDSQLVWDWKLSVISNWGTPHGLNACRAVLLLTYHDLCPRRIFKKIWYTILFTWFLLIVQEVGVCIIYTCLMCYPKPLSVSWSLTEVCDEQSKYLVTKYATSVTLDVLVYVIPIIIIQYLRNLTITQRIGVAMMFAIGFVNVAVLGLCLASLVVRMLDTSEVFWHGMRGIILLQYGNSIMLPTALIVVCIPQLRILGRWKFARKVVDTLTSRRGRVEATAVTADPVSDTVVTSVGSDEHIPVGDLEKAVPVVSVETASA